MCLTKAARVISLEGAKASVRFLDTGTVGEVDISMVDAKKDSYVEVFADRAIGRLSKREAEYKRDLRLELDRIEAAAEP